MLNNRLKELENKKTLTDQEMKELIELSGEGVFKKLPNAYHLGIDNLESFIFNLETATQKIKDAFAQGFYLEVISLRIQYIELFLRIYLVSKNGECINNSDRRPFGAFIKDLDKTDFNQELKIKLDQFNRDRIDSVHKFILGNVIYSDLKDICDKSKELPCEIRDYVVSNIK